MTWIDSLNYVYDPRNETRNRVCSALELLSVVLIEYFLFVCIALCVGAIITRS